MEMELKHAGLQGLGTGAGAGSPDEDSGVNPSQW